MAIILPVVIVEARAMRVQTKIFELCPGEYRNLSELAQVMGISVSQIYRVRRGKRNINQKFIIGALKAFPHHKMDELFYLAPETPRANENRGRPNTSKQLAPIIRLIEKQPQS
jgi:transcriptional regulator with XRE-family HTH domain